MELFVPFRRGRLCITPQGFTARVPSRERALAVAGKAAACRLCGYTLAAVVSRWDAAAVQILSAGGVPAVSLDRLREWLSQLS